MGLWRLDLSDASPAIPLPRRRRRRDLRCYSIRRTSLPNPYASRLSFSPPETTHKRTRTPTRIRSNRCSRNHEPRILPKYKLGRCKGKENTAAIRTYHQERHRYQQFRQRIYERYSCSDSSAIRLVLFFRPHRIIC